VALHGCAHCASWSTDLGEVQVLAQPRNPTDGPFMILEPIDQDLTEAGRSLPAATQRNPILASLRSTRCSTACLGTQLPDLLLQRADEVAQACIGTTHLPAMSCVTILATMFHILET
jgi:hypothetical protein